jgi:hypothetical protein
MYQCKRNIFDRHSNRTDERSGERYTSLKQKAVKINKERVRVFPVKLGLFT